MFFVTNALQVLIVALVAQKLPLPIWSIISKWSGVLSGGRDVVDETCWCCILSLEAAASDITVIPDQLILLSSISCKDKQRF